MSGTTNIFQLTATSFFQGYQGSNQTQTYAQTRTIYIYAPEEDEQHIAHVLERANIPHVINHYNIQNYEGKVLCYYRRSELKTPQIQYLVDAAAHGASIEPLMDYLDQRQQFVEIELLHGDYLLDEKLLQQARGKQRQRHKRIMDVAVSLFLLLLSLPVWALTALAIKLESPGPVFFKQRRTGLFNREFEIIKFRSMCQDAEKDGARWASKNDSRITRIGSFIRKTRIDELPQLINVLRGDMSLIGPRPEREVFIHDLEKHIPFYRFRHMVKPGVTGLAQVRYSYGASIEDAKHKHRHDIYYIKHQNGWMDLKILLDTVRIVVTGKGV